MNSELKPIQRAKAATLQEFKENFIRLGFELETQSVAGKTYDQLVSQTVTVKKTREVSGTDPVDFKNITCDQTFHYQINTKFRKIAIDLAEIISKYPNMQVNCLDYSGYRLLLASELFGTVWSRSKRNYVKIFKSRFNLSTLREIAAQCDDEDKAAVTAIAARLLKLQLSRIQKAKFETTTEEYEEKQPISLKDYLVSLGFDIANFNNKWEPDGSVRGPEIKTEGPNTLADATLKITKLFEDLDKHGVEIDTHCSFHIHASINGVTPKHSKLFQAFLMRTILNDPRVPVSVRERWENQDQLTRYFNFGLDQQKYRFVAIRDANTWEFRCFGNVKNLADAIVCLNIVAETYYAAITATDLGFSLPFGVSFADVCHTAANSGSTFDDALSDLTENIEQSRGE